MFVTGMAAMMMGLLLSALVGSPLAAVVLVPLLILPQILLCGQLAPVGGEDARVVTRVLAAPMLLRWAYSAVTQVEYPPSSSANDESAAAYRAEKGREWVLPRLGFAQDSHRVPLLVVMLMGLMCAVATYLVLRRTARQGKAKQA